MKYFGRLLLLIVAMFALEVLGYGIARSIIFFASMSLKQAAVVMIVHSILTGTLWHICSWKKFRDLGKAAKVHSIIREKTGLQ